MHAGKANRNAGNMVLPKAGLTQFFEDDEYSVNILTLLNFRNAISLTSAIPLPVGSS
jgi:hypothetical protein